MRLFELALRNLEGLSNEFQALDLVQFREILLRYRDAIIAVDFTKIPGHRRLHRSWNCCDGGSRNRGIAAPFAQEGAELSV